MENKVVNINIHTSEEYMTIELAGKLEYGLIEDIKKELHDQHLDADHDYILDMRKVMNIDSTGFGMIVNFAKKVTVKGKKIVIIVVDDFVRNLFAISQCDKVFPIVRSEEEAREVLHRNWRGELSLNEY